MARRKLPYQAGIRKRSGTLIQTTKIRALQTQVPILLRGKSKITEFNSKNYRLVWTKKGKDVKVRLKKVS